MTRFGVLARTGANECCPSSLQSSFFFGCPWIVSEFLRWPFLSGRTNTTKREIGTKTFRINHQKIKGGFVRLWIGELVGRMRRWIGIALVRKSSSTDDNQSVQKEEICGCRYMTTHNGNIQSISLSLSVADYRWTRSRHHLYRIDDGLVGGSCWCATLEGQNRWNREMQLSCVGCVATSLSSGKGGLRRSDSFSKWSNPLTHGSALTIPLA